ncbi:hypothetical protein EXN66_Car004754 [Channa argus]|uniref:Uncharacterized protein n=1 Tax=Channa argus TaxID=215402 RepID=A0A6G1PFR7_CHAAH|nr:hypothetical protein EXN66_Car004754 [Channa argus]
MYSQLQHYCQFICVHDVSFGNTVLMTDDGAEASVMDGFDFRYFPAQDVQICLWRAVAAAAAARSWTRITIELTAARSRQQRFRDFRLNCTLKTFR